MVVHAKMRAMTLEMRLREVVVKKRVVLQFRKFELRRTEIERTLQNAEGFFFAENPRGSKVADVRAEILRLLEQGGLSLGDLPAVQPEACARGKAGAEVSKGLSWIFGNLNQGVREGTTRRERWTEHDEKGRKRKQVVRFCLEVREAVADRRGHHGPAAEGIGEALPVTFKEQLIDTVVFVEEPQCRFKTLR